MHLEGPEVESAAAIANLLRTAEDAVSRSDWKLAIDSLQRVIDEPAGLRPAEFGGGRIYESTRAYAQRQLAHLPPEGLEAYRILYDGRAKNLLEAARRDVDLEGLERLVGQYALTSYAPAAAELLASWFLDLGRPFDALRLLTELAAIAPAGSAEPTSRRLQRATALAMIGDERAAQAILDELAKEGGQAEANSGGETGGADASVIEAVGQFVAAHGSARASPSRVGDQPAERGMETWAGPGGGGPCTGRMDAVVPSFAEKLPWRRAIPSVASGVWPDFDDLQANLLPTIQPAAADGRLFVKAGRETVAIDLQSFALLWTSRNEAVGIAERGQIGRASCRERV